MAVDNIARALAAKAMAEGSGESNSSKVGTSSADSERLKAIYYTAEDEIPEDS